jgi:hypothetical protein
VQGQKCYRQMPCDVQSTRNGNLLIQLTNARMNIACFSTERFLFLGNTGVSTWLCTC